MESSRRLFLTYICIIAASVNLLLQLTDLSIAKAESSNTHDMTAGKKIVEKNPKVVATSLLKELSERPSEKIKSLKLLYDVYMVAEWKVKTKMSATLEMEKDKDHYISTFSLTEPVGKNLWSKFALFVYGKHTQEYKEMIKSIKTRLQETYRLKNKRFLSKELKEILPNEKSYKNQSGIRVYFDYTENLIKFWEDQTKEDFSKSIKYTNQVGPMAGFFNFVLFEKPKTDLNIINALKQVEDLSTSSKTSPGKKKVTFFFGAEDVKLRDNSTGRHIEYPNAIYFQGDSYLDIIYGKNIYYKLVYNSSTNVKIPYSVHLDGIISKTKKRKKEQALKQLLTRNPDTRAYEQELEIIETMGELAAKSVKVSLRQAKVIFE
jgi:hypothetical protein